jgi:hypothetical protein
MILGECASRSSCGNTRAKCAHQAAFKPFHFSIGCTISRVAMLHTIAGVFGCTSCKKVYSRYRKLVVRQKRLFLPAPFFAPFSAKLSITAWLSSEWVVSIIFRLYRCFQPSSCLFYRQIARYRAIHHILQIRRAVDIITLMF